MSEAIRRSARFVDKPKLDYATMKRKDEPAKMATTSDDVGDGKEKGADVETTKTQNKQPSTRGTKRVCSTLEQK